MERKVIQIAVSATQDTDHVQGCVFVVALCDDGTIWFTAPNAMDWKQIDAIPTLPHVEQERIG